MPPRTKAEQRVFEDGFDIVRQFQKINTDFSEVIDSKELTYLNEGDRLDFLEVMRDYNSWVENLGQHVNDLYRLVKSINGSIFDPDDPSKQLVKEKLLSLRDEDIFKDFNHKCDRLISNIQNNDEYQEEKRGETKNLVAGIASLVGLGGAVVLVVLHCVPGLNFFLSLVELILVAVMGAGMAISAVVNLYFYKRKTKILKNDIDKLLLMVRKYREKATKIQPPHQEVNSFALLPVNAIDFVELEESLKRLKEVIATPSVESEKSSETSSCIIC